MILSQSCFILHKVITHDRPANHTIITPSTTPPSEPRYAVQRPSLVQSTIPPTAVRQANGRTAVFDFSQAMFGTVRFTATAKTAGEVDIKPQPAGLQYAKLKTPTPHGTIEMVWENSPNKKAWLEITRPGQIKLELEASSIEGAEVIDN